MVAGQETGRRGKVGRALAWGRSRLAGSRSLSDTASLDAQLLLAHVLGRSRAWLFAHPEAELGPEERSAYAALIDRRARGEPVAYLRGFVEWFGMELAVTPQVLIPRPETELLAERAIEMAGTIGAKVVADIGTGSGAIAIALARSLLDARIDAVDASEASLALAAQNVRRHGLSDRVSLIHGSLLEPLREEPDMVVANLPYLSDDMMTSLTSDVGYEPRSALQGGGNGLELYEVLLCQLTARGWSMPLLFEIDPRQRDLIEPLVRRSYPNAAIELMRDYAGWERVVVVEPR